MALIHSQMRLHNLIETLQAHNDRFGYERLETPMIQPADLFLTKAGDQLIQRLYAFERFGRQWALRPEFTASAATAYSTGSSGSGITPNSLPTRWQFAGPVFEDVPGSSEVQQHHSVGVELLNWRSLTADAETILLTVEGLDAVGITATVTIGSMRFIRALLESYQFDPRLLRFLLDHVGQISGAGKDYVLDRFDKLTFSDISASADSTATLNLLMQGGGVLSGRTRDDIVARLTRKMQRSGARGAVIMALDQLEALSKINNPAPEAFQQIRALLTPQQEQARLALHSLESLMPLLQAGGMAEDRVIIRPALARDWNYYTDIVFEAASPHGVILAGGGRYNDLVRLMGGVETAAVGAAFYIDRIAEAAPMAHAASVTTLYMATTPETAHVAIAWAAKLRAVECMVVLIDPPAQPMTDLLKVQPNGELVFRGTLYTQNRLVDLLLVLQNEEASHA